MCVACAGQALALHSHFGAHCHLRGSRGHGLAWLCWAQPADWAGLRTQLFHSGVMGTADFIPADHWSGHNCCQDLAESLQAPWAAVWLTHVGFGATRDPNCRKGPAHGFWPSQSSVDPSKS